MRERNRIAGSEIANQRGTEDAAIRIRSRRNKLLGLWAARHLGLGDDTAEADARDMVATGVHRGGDDALVARRLEDFAAHGTTVSDASIRREMERLMNLAALEYSTAPPDPRASNA